MPFLLLLLLTPACLWKNWPQPWEWLGLPGNAALFAALTWLSMAAMVAAAACLARWVCRALERDPVAGESILHRYRRWRLYHLLALLACYGVALFILGWGWAVQSLGPIERASGRPQLFPGAELLILAPFLTALVLSWMFFFDADRALQQAAGTRSAPGPAPGSEYGGADVVLATSAPGEAGRVGLVWSRRAYVGFQVRQNLALLCVPLLLLIAEKALYWGLGESASPGAFQISVVGLLGAAFVGLPWVLRLFLGLQPLPQGPLRQRLLATARRLHFRCSNILLWNTHGGVANAMVAGVLPWVRYVVLTDRLVSELSPEELEAVFGHEIGHVKHRHMLYYLSFLLVSLAVVAVLWELIAPAALKANDDLQMVLPIAVLGPYIFVVFGFLSRRCERQADIFGCRAVSCAQPDCSQHGAAGPLLPEGRGLCPTGIRIFVEALEKVARVNGISRHRPGWLQSWQHSTIARRVEFLERLQADPALEPRFQRTVKQVKWALLVGLCALLLILVGIECYLSTKPGEREAEIGDAPQAVSALFAPDEQPQDR